MSMVACDECGKQRSSEAIVCPQCGASPYNKFIQIAKLVVFGMAIVYGVSKLIEWIY